MGKKGLAKREEYWKDIEAQGQVREMQERKGDLFLDSHELKCTACRALYSGEASRSSHLVGNRQVNTL